MRMFRRRAGNDPEDDVASATDDRGANAPTKDATGAAPTAIEPRTWHHGPTRALMTLLGGGVAGLLAWLTTNIGDTSNGGYWAAYGILAGAGLVLALSQLVGGWTKWGRPTMSPMVFVLAFVPTLIAVGWIVLFHQPHGNWFRSHVVSWSGDIGIDGFVNDMGGALLTMLSFGLGLVFGFCFDTKGARRLAAPAPREQAQPRAADIDADRSMAREREQDEQRTTVRP